jgi:hypothetical protein
MEAGRALGAAAVPDPVGVAAVQLLRARLEALCGEALASLSSEAAVLLARNVSDRDLSQHLLIEALLCAARGHRADDRLDLARRRASEALAEAQVRVGTSDPATAECWRELGKICDAMDDATAANAAYQEARNTGETGK